MHLYIATASHLSSLKGVGYLNHMFRSVERAFKATKDLTITFILSVSLADSKLKELVQFPTDHSVIVLWQKNKMVQFDHFNWISQKLDEINAKMDDSLMIMDDDDLLLEFPDCLGRDQYLVEVI